MKRGIIISLVLLAVVIGLTIFPKVDSHDAPRAALGNAFDGKEPRSARDIRVEFSGLRELVIEIFFRADPKELEATLASAPFHRDDTMAEPGRLANLKFAELTGAAAGTGLLAFSRSDLPASAGRYCFVVTDAKYSFGYVCDVDMGPPPK